jgi:hypothetical protein
MAEERRKRRKEYLPEHEKMERGVKLNIWDAARSRKEKVGDKRGLREIVADPSFRNQWRTFRGGGLKRGKPTSTKAKFRAAQYLGWYESQAAAVNRLRNLSP